MCRLLALALVCVSTFAADRKGVLRAPVEGTVGWHREFSLANGGLWQRRIVLTASAGRAVAGEVASITIADAAGQANLVGANATQVRVCSADGVELLFKIVGGDGKEIRAGVIPAGAKLLVPVELAEKGTTRLQVYFDNPLAWPLPEFLDTRSIAKDVSLSAGVLELLPLKTSDEPVWMPVRGHGYRVPVRVANFSDSPVNALVEADLSAVLARPPLSKASTSVVGVSGLVPATRINQSLLFETTLAPGTLAVSHAYLSTESAPADPRASYDALVARPINLIRNPTFETGLDGWQFPKDAAAADKGTARFTNTTSSWSGLTQSVPVLPGQRYLISAYLRTQVVTGKISLHVHFHTASGKPTASQAITSLPGSLSGDNDWTVLSGVMTAPPDAARLTLHLTTNCPGTVWYDSVMVAPVVSALVGPLESRHSELFHDTVAWAIDPVVKVFREDLPPLPPQGISRLSAAGNEYEPMQVALRSRQTQAGVKVVVDALKHASGVTLPAPQVSVVGYVPIDTRTNYYRSEARAWERRIPGWGGSSDGWPGWWPDPLIPTDTFDLPAHTTQPVWLTFKVPANQAPGNYTGTIRFISDDKTINTLPLTFHVHAFALPDQTHVKAIYDLRSGNRWKQEGKDWNQTFQELSHFMSQRRLCPDRIDPEPVIKFENGKAVCDFTEYDKAGDLYFNRDRHLHTYTPHLFYGFGWAHPPGKKFGQAPYPGDFPYSTADPSVLRPEYKQAYQACLKAYLDHMREKGWYDKVILYLSDEPHFGPVKKRNTRILAQMKALCDMIREVDPKLPIYSSTWEHVPEWNGVITAWGIGAYGVVPVPVIDQIKTSSRALWTVDGHMCTDTPYNAIERLLPWYCFKYGLEGYEFWGANWLTYDPWQFGWHSFIKQADSPGHDYYVRYPNGDGYLIYPSASGPVSSVRLEQAREGVEDYEYFHLLQQRIDAAKQAGRDATAAQAVLNEATALVTIPNAGGRFSTSLLPSPEKLQVLRAKVARAIESLALPAN